ncbi:MAG: hypothetical protein ABI605_05775 [Rhizobacter sp.]
MSTNPYAPPTANVEDVLQANESPPIWNPEVAARWSLLFSPIFGATIQMKNWQALGEPEKAAQARQWALGSIGFFALLMVAGIFLPESTSLNLGSRVAGLGLLIAWYTLNGKQQVAYVTAHFGKTYPRKNWGVPLLYALLSLVAFLVLVFVIAFVFGLLQGDA